MNTLFDPPRPLGETLTTADVPRLARQYAAVRALMADGAWRTLAAISAATGAPEASCSARLRDARRDPGVARVERRRVPGGNGLHEYRLIAQELRNG